MYLQRSAGIGCSGCDVFVTPNGFLLIATVLDGWPMISKLYRPVDVPLISKQIESIFGSIGT
jgi:hypothetical protein